MTRDIELLKVDVDIIGIAVGSAAHRRRPACKAKARLVALRREAMQIWVAALAAAPSPSIIGPDIPIPALLGNSDHPNTLLPG